MYASDDTFRSFHIRDPHHRKTFRQMHGFDLSIRSCGDFDPQRIPARADGLGNIKDPFLL
jgi:hypothetical protein